MKLQLPMLLVLSVLFTSCSSTRVTNEFYAVSLTGQELPAPQFDTKKELQLLVDLQDARVKFERDPKALDNIIWFGRRLAYLGRYQEAIEVYTDGLSHHPKSYRLLRHRGHRYITTRQLKLAIADLNLAAQYARGKAIATEPDGIPNARNTPIGTTQGNIYYHLGLAHYLRGDFRSALAAYERRRQETDRNDDNHASTAYWLYLIHTRLGQVEKAKSIVEPISKDMDIIENHTYRDLVLLFKGDLQLNDLADADPATDILNATKSYGVSMFHFLNGSADIAFALWQKLTKTSTATSAFGYIAAEAELARMK